MPAKEGERTLGGNTLPPDPLVYARSLKHLDPALHGWLQQWHTAVAAGQPLSEADSGPPLNGTRLVPHELYEIGRGVRFVQGNAKRPLSFYKAAVARAAETLADISPDSLTPSQQRDRQALRMMARPLWQARDYEAAQPLFEVLAPLEPEGTFARFRALYLRAESPYMRAIRGGEPSYAPIAVTRFERMYLDGDTGGYEPTELERSELVWAMGASLFATERHEDALPYLEQAAALGNMPFTNSAKLHHVLALARTGRKDAAREALAQANLPLDFRLQAEKDVPPPPPAWEVKINMSPEPDSERS